MADPARSRRANVSLTSGISHPAFGCVGRLLPFLCRRNDPHGPCRTAAGTARRLRKYATGTVRHSRPPPPETEDEATAHPAGPLGRALLCRAVGAGEPPGRERRPRAFRADPPRERPVPARQPRGHLDAALARLAR